MSIRKNYADRTTTFTCDDCGEPYECEGIDFYDALQGFKDYGGRAVLEDGEWRHLCEACA